MTSFNEKQQLNNNTYNDQNIQAMDKSAKSQDFIQDNIILGKRYTMTCNKSKNFLSNIASVDINIEDYYNENFVLNVYLLVTKNQIHSC